MKDKGKDVLRETIGKCKRVFLLIAIFGLCINMLMLTAPLYMMQVFDRVISSHNTDTLIMLFLIATLALVTMAMLEGVRTFILVRLSSWIDRQLGPGSLNSSIFSQLKQGENPNTQGLRDLGTFRGFLTGAGIFPILDAPFAPLFLGIMFLLHPLLGGIALAGAGILFSFALMNEILTRRPLAMSGQYTIKAMEQAEASARNADVIEAMGMMPALTARWNKINHEAMILQAKASDRGGIISSFSKFFRMILQIGISTAAAWLVIQGDLTAGAMIAASLIMGRALAPVEQAIGTWKGFVGARAAYGRLKSRIEKVEEDEPGMPLPRPKGAISVENVSFVHPGAKKPVLKNISFKINPGEIVGLIGPTAAGKSTLSRIMIGNLHPTSGHSRLDNMDVSEWPSSDRGQYVGYLPQDIELFAGTIKDNISRMREGDPDLVVEAAKKAGVHEMILRMEKGYETEIGEGGAALSGGQRQRIALARAIYGNPCLLVLDEPNANLDSDGEAALMKAMDALANDGMTIIIVAHRPNVLRYADKIIVLRDGMLDDYGFRDDILDKLQGASRPVLQKLTKPSEEKVSAQPHALPSEKDDNQNSETIKTKEEGVNSNIARIQRLKSIQNKAARRSRQAGNLKNSEDKVVGMKPEQESGKIRSEERRSSTPPPITEAVREEIISLADRDLSEQEIQEIYGFYASGDRNSMLKKLKGLG
ncbi:type I secretion system permease/ATPase [Sneathiella sp. P13V-1]|uniref:type I secretion system permease/ATPase n=1 Tax=Sneathiella sp. P13V-1 TaxID=2697366 RepID=UPI00187B9189|nr:type I secretion system permease/ATPase [Sneathiella sp. P13V-1]MBE7636408.1 type I secretion system permease/ATPase [Sneathiella sp. P13V-1]